MIISPQIGLHENVVVLDYENECANLIINYNLSYKTVPSSVTVRVVEQLLKRRAQFKNLREFPVRIRRKQISVSSELKP
jgi:DNA polymerase elongation subunit (family B)